MDKNFNHLIIMHRTIDKKIFEEYDFQRGNIQNVHIQNCIFNDCDFNRSSLTNLRITNCNFYGCKFVNIDFSFCKLSNCIFKDCDFSLSEIENNIFFESTLSNTKFISSRITDNTFRETSFFKIDLNGSTTKFNCFEETIWTDSVFGNCTIDYNVAIRCKFRETKMNLETLGSVWGIQENELENVTFLSLGRELAENKETIYKNYNQYLIKKRLCLEMFTFQVSLKKKNLFNSLEQLLNSLDERNIQGQYLSPDEFRYFYEILKAMRKESMLPLLALKEIILFYQKLIHKFSTDDNYYETILLFYNNICLIYNSMTHELLSYQDNLSNDDVKYQVKIIFKEKPKQDIVQVFSELYQYVYNISIVPNIQFVKDAYGSYIVWLIMPLSVLASFNIGTLLLTGGVKHLIKLRASIEVLLSKKLPRKYYLDVYHKDDSEELTKGIISTLLSGKISSLPSKLFNLSCDGINAQNIQDISVKNNETE